MHGHFRRVALTACVLLGALPARQARAAVFCLSPRQCRQPDTMSVLLRPASEEIILDANFGLVYQSPQGGWQYTCDDTFGGRIPYASRVSRDGRVFVPAMDGLWVGAEGCGWTHPQGSPNGGSAYDVAFDPVDPQRIWLLGGDPRVAALSVDGGQSFVDKHQFPPELLFIRIQVAPSDPRVVYVTGFNGTKAPLVMGVSTDGGTTWALDGNASMGVATSQQIVDFLGVSPDDPQTVYVVVTSGQGDEIWKSTNQGHGLVKVLTLADQEEWPRGGFTFGADGKTVYVAGYDPLNTGTQPPASLYISHDSGQTWERRPSPATGPRYRCLGYRAGKLYACAGEQLSGDQFFLGESTDEGRNWNSLIKLTDVKGPRECAALKCMGTVDFLAPFKNGGGAGGSGGGGRDGGAADVARPVDAPVNKPISPPKSGCTFAGDTGAPTGSVLLLALVALAARRKRPGRGGG